MNYTQWMNDRQKMSKNIVDVGVGNLQIKIEGDTAIAQFVQQFQSAGYQDTGQKTMRIKMFSEGAKIVYEELKTSIKIMKNVRTAIIYLPTTMFFV